MAFEFRLPDIGEGVAEGEIVKWLVKPGDSIREDQPLLEVMTDKVTAEIPAPVSGTVVEFKAQEGETVRVGSVIVLFEVGAGKAAAAPAKSPSEVPPAATASTNGHGKAAQVEAPATLKLAPASNGSRQKVLAAPATRKLARSMGVDLAAIAGSGPHGRVTPEDLRTQAPGGVTAVASRPVSPAAPHVARSVLPTGAREERVPFRGMRKRIAEHLTHAKHTAPHFGYVDEVDMSMVVSMRNDLKADAEAEGISLTYLPFIIKAVISGLKAFPVVNSSLDDAKQELVYKHYYNLGIAVATDDGLIVPVLKDADQKSLKALALELKSLSDRARAGRLELADLQGGTFTLTSIGSIGGLFGIPIINHPEVGILGINKIEKRPVVRNDEIVIRQMMHLSLSCDHRVVDGVDGARFVNHVKACLENPGRLLWE